MIDEFASDTGAYDEPLTTVLLDALDEMMTFVGSINQVPLFPSTIEPNTFNTAPEVSILPPSKLAAFVCAAFSVELASMLVKAEKGRVSSSESLPIEIRPPCTVPVVVTVVDSSTVLAAPDIKTCPPRPSDPSAFSVAPFIATTPLLLGATTWITPPVKPLAVMFEKI